MKKQSVTVRKQLLSQHSEVCIAHLPDPRRKKRDQKIHPQTVNVASLIFTCLADFFVYQVYNEVRAIPFSKAHWGTQTFLGATYHHNSILLTPPAHFKFNITLRNTLCHPLLPHFDLFTTPALRITFRSPADNL